MKLIICLDTRNGMSFYRRRQSRDRAVLFQIAKLIGDGTLRMHPASKSLFNGMNLDILTAEDYLCDAAENDWCFVEFDDATPYLHLAKTIVVFRWHCAYPYDCKFPYEKLNSDFVLSESIEFEGYSHPSITMEVYSQ